MNIEHNCFIKINRLYNYIDMYGIPGNAYIIQINKQRFATIAQVW